MSDRRFQFAFDLTASGRRAELRVIQHTINGLTLNLIVVSIIIAVAIIPAQLADWTA